MYMYMCIYIHTLKQIGRWGQLGHKIFNHYTEEFVRPTVIERLLGHHIVDIAVGYAHTLFLDNTGCVWVCGVGLNGRLGCGMGSLLSQYPIPRPMTPLWRQHLKMSHFKSQFDFTENKLLLSDDSHDGVSTDKYKLLTDDTGQAMTPYDSYDYNTYYDIQKYKAAPAPENQVPYYVPEVAKISAGHKHSAILTTDGKVFCFGGGNTGAIGVERDFMDKCWPTQVTGGGLEHEFVIDVQCGQNHTAALTKSGKVYTWGSGRFGQCGRERKQAFMLEDIRERGCDLRTVPHRPPYELVNTSNPINATYNFTPSEDDKTGALHDRDVQSFDDIIDVDDGILIRGDPLAMPPGVIQNFPSHLKPKRIVAGFYETSIITG
ncbi:regulator of chromosome condensation (RCC1) [Reticulomyxa filosa]|uniref:Regulator of chromosome condensation (RCC1) n=1 Tax=Reticulomyxa filosa TaxID=46433 RepID=X6MXR4_RETFI|nr:regulator of chromosome condensation (RCC1) [Reticulomyxa filosa]|eukprot:ETO18282.1 regulator of chromosome condensation (RCC1) [Reticulomyxa filosa]